MEQFHVNDVKWQSADLLAAAVLVNNLIAISATTDALGVPIMLLPGERAEVILTQLYRQLLMAEGAYRGAKAGNRQGA